MYNVKYMEHFLIGLSLDLLLLIYLIFRKSKLAKRLINWLWKYLKPFTNWKFLISFGLAWMITNGWCYIFIGFGIAFKIAWMTAIGSTYAAFLYFPLTVEKPVTIAISIFLQTKLFPKDEKLRIALLEMKKQARQDLHTVKDKLVLIRLKTSVLIERNKKKRYGKR